MQHLLALLALSAAPAAQEAGLIGQRIPDLDGIVHHLGLEHGAAPVALVFLDTGCPIANKMAPRLGELAGLAAEEGVEFYGVLSDPTITPAEGRAHSEEYGLSFPVLWDASGDLAALLAPRAVPEAFVVGSDDRLLYRGRIDDRFEAPTRQRATVTRHDLADAIQGHPQEPRTEPVGCEFEAWEGAEERTPTWHRDVAPLVAANCLGCHREDDVGPFAFTEYEGTKRRARTIARVVRERLMPPWYASEDCGPFRDERRLSGGQIARLEAWAAAGAPEGDPEEALPAPPVPDGRWRLGEPDLVIEMPESYSVPAEGDDIYRYFVVPNELVGERMIRAIDFRPGDPSVVHHCIAYADFTGVAARIDAMSEEPGFSVFGEHADSNGERFEPNGLDTTTQIAGWAPGTQPYVLPDGLGQRLAPGGDFVLEIHYHLTGKATEDRSALALYFADEPVERVTQSLVIGTQNIDIEAGEPEYVRHVWMEVPADLEVIDVSPHMHYLGRTAEVVATLPEGDVVPLITIEDWDFRWQGAYFYREPVRLPAGSRIDAYFVFDNSAENPFNPSVPPVRVREGWRTTDEMCLFYFTVVPDDPARADDIFRAMFASFRRSGAPD